LTGTGATNGDNSHYSTGYGGFSAWFLASERDSMLDNYYQIMGWDEKTSKPLTDTLKGLGVEHIIPDLW